MKITVAICTRNRAGLLSKTLASLARAIPPARAAWEVIIVDNASIDETGAVVASFRNRLPIVSVHEPNAGVSRARNAAVHAASGDYMLWTDDDVRVDADWLITYERAFASYPDAAVFGGAISPTFEDQPPKWLLDAFDGIDTAYATRALPAFDTPIDPTREMPFGANFALRSIEQRRRLYDPALGRRPGKMIIGGEEIKVIREIFQDGAKGWWIPAAKVEHWIPRNRQTLRYLRRYYEGQGWVQFLERPERDRARGSPFGLLRDAIRARIFFILKRPVSPPPTSMQLRVNAWMAWGRYRASLRSK